MKILPHKKRIFPAALTILATLFQGNFELVANVNISDEEAFRRVREISRGGRLPDESLLVEIANGSASSRTRDLAALVRARLRLESKDFIGAVQILGRRNPSTSTKIADYNLWLKAQSLFGAKDYRRTIDVLEDLNTHHKDSILLNDAVLLKAESLIELGDYSSASKPLEGLKEENNLRA